MDHDTLEKEKAERRLKEFQRLGISLCCYLCGKPFGLKKDKRPTRDHIIPVSDPRHRGLKDNVRWAHKRCNGTRGNTPLTYYRMLQLFEKVNRHHAERQKTKRGF